MEVYFNIPDTVFDNLWKRITSVEMFNNLPAVSYLKVCQEVFNDGLIRGLIVLELKKEDGNNADLPKPISDWLKNVELGPCLIPFPSVENWHFIRGATVKNMIVLGTILYGEEFWWLDDKVMIDHLLQMVLFGEVKYLR